MHCRDAPGQGEGRMSTSSRGRRGGTGRKGGRFKKVPLPAQEKRKLSFVWPSQCPGNCKMKGQTSPLEDSGATLLSGNRTHPGGGDSFAVARPTACHIELQVQSSPRPPRAGIKRSRFFYFSLSAENTWFLGVSEEMI